MWRRSCAASACTSFVAHESPPTAEAKAKLVPHIVPHLGPQTTSVPCRLWSIWPSPGLSAQGRTPPTAPSPYLGRSHRTGNSLSTWGPLLLQAKPVCTVSGLQRTILSTSAPLSRTSPTPATRHRGHPPHQRLCCDPRPVVPHPADTAAWAPPGAFSPRVQPLILPSVRNPNQARWWWAPTSPRGWPPQPWAAPPLPGCACDELACT